jgi:hypothetical protein
MVHQGDLIPQRHLAAADQPRIRDRMMGGATWTSRERCHARTRRSGDAVDAGGLNGLSQGHTRRDGGGPASPVSVPVPPSLKTYPL